MPACESWLVSRSSRKATVAKTVFVEYSDLLANGMFGYVLSVYEFRVHYLYLGKQDHSWQLKQVRQTTFGCQKWSPEPVLVAKFGPASTIIGKGGPFLATKSSPGRPFLAAKIGPGDRFWAGPIFA